MRKLIKAYDVYNYEELSPEIQMSILERFMEEEYEDYCNFLLHDDMMEDAKDLLLTYFKGANYNNIYYDLSYSQGSGSMIEFNIDLEDLNEKYKMLNVEELNKCTSIGFTEIVIKHNNANYCHEYTFDIEWNDYTDYDDFEEIQDKIDNMIKLFREDIVSINKELTERAYKHLENTEYFKELALTRINECEFLSDGSVFQ